MDAFQINPWEGGRERGRERGREGNKDRENRSPGTHVGKSYPPSLLPSLPPPLSPSRPLFSVFMQEYFKSEDFPANMPPIWQAHWAFAKQLTGSAVVIGEWGGW